MGFPKNLLYFGMSYEKQWIAMDSNEQQWKVWESKGM
jgi:hypothetical protein